MASPRVNTLYFIVFICQKDFSYGLGAAVKIATKFQDPDKQE